MFTEILLYLQQNIFGNLYGVVPLFDFFMALTALFLTVVIVMFPFMMVYWFIRRFL